MAGENDTIGIYQELLNRNAVPPEHRETVGELVRRGVLKSAQQEPQNSLLKYGTDTLRNFNDALTFGFYDKGVAAAKTAIGAQPNYDEAIKQERAATNAAGGLPWLVGQTAGNVVQGLATMPAAAANATGQAVSAGRAFLQGIPEAARYGAAYGAANAAGHSDSKSMGEAVSDVATGAATGALLGPTIYTGMYGAGLAAQKFGQMRADTRLANQERLAEARAVGIDNPLPGIVSDNAGVAYATRTAGAGIGGNPVGARAAENIGQLQTNLNRTLSRPLDGQEAGDLGRNIQGDLRRALTMPSRTSEEIAGMSKADLQEIAGPLTAEGFQPPRPNVNPIAPKQFEPVQPRDVGPPPEAPMARARVQELADEFAAKEREIAAAAANHNEMVRARSEVEARYKPTFDQYAKLQEQEKTLRAEFEKLSEGPFIKYRRPGESVASYQNRLADMARQHAALVEQINKVVPEVEVAQKAMARFGDPEARISSIRQLHDQKNRLESRVAAMRAQDAADTVAYTKARDDYSASQSKAAADAAEETARLQEQARLDAQRATTEAQRAAEARYQRQIAEGNTGFKVGGSKESYPTELSAAYELSYREAPKIRVNPLGNGYVGTNTTKLLDQVAKEGKSNLSIRDFNGKPFDDETGGLAEPFKNYLRSRLGNDMAERFEVLAEIRSRGIVAQPALDGMKSLLSDMRTLAREAEKSRYSPQPRTEDAALLRRLATSIQRDIYDQLSKAGRPESFKTATGDYKVLDAGRSQFGDKAPTDATYYVSQDNFQRLTRGTGKADSTYSIPATLSLKAEKGQIGYFKNREGEFDRSSLIPFSHNPEPGMVPIQVWADGTRITYGSPVISRATTSGERAVAMFKNVDEQYSQYVSELRKPLSKVFGENVKDVQALDRLVTAAKKGESGLLGAYMRVMAEKSDPTKGAAAVIYHMTGGGKDMSRFMNEWRELSPVSKRILFDTPQARQLEQELTRYVNVGQRLEKFVNASRQQALVSPSRLTHIMTASLAITQFPVAVSMVAGNAVAARVLSSPRLVQWMTDSAKASRGGFDTQAFRNHMARLSALANSGNEQDLARAMLVAVNQTIGATPAKAERYDSEYDPEADQTYREQGDAAVERPFPVPQFVPPQSFRDSIYMTPPNSFPGRGLNLEDKPNYLRQQAEERMPRIMGR